MVIAHELDALRFVRAGWAPPELWWAIVENSRRAASVGRQWGPYRYAVQGQGTWRRLRVIGDKNGGLTTLATQRDPASLDRLQATIPVPIRWVHVVRSPWDNIATIRRKGVPDSKQAIVRYFGLAQGVDRARARLPDNAVLTVYHEDLIQDPRSVLRALAAFLEVTPDEAWIDAGASIVRPRPSRSRDRVAWSAADIHVIGTLARRHDWLDRFGLRP